MGRGGGTVAASEAAEGVDGGRAACCCSFWSTLCICERSWLRRCTRAASSAPLQLDAKLMVPSDEQEQVLAAVLGRFVAPTNRLAVNPPGCCISAR